MPGRVLVCFLPVETDEAKLSGASAIVVDLLRASTTISHALGEGARDVIPAKSVAEALEARRSMSDEPILLCGERLGVRIEGFDLGNSPLEYKRDVVNGKRLVFASSNGSAALLRARTAQRLAVGCLNNLSAVADWAAAGSGDCHVICAGKLGQFAADDAACAGQFVRELKRRGFTPDGDAAHTAHQLAESAALDWPDYVRKTSHGRYLSELGFTGDLSFASQVDSHEHVPVWRGDRLMLGDS